MARAQRSPTLPKDAHPIYGQAQAKWRSSGLNDKHAAKLLLRPLTREEVQGRLGVSDARPCGVEIPYFDFEGKPTAFFRIRYLEKPLGFAGQAEKPQRYVQPAKTLNEVYLPPLLDKSWKEISQDEAVTIYVTEGEFKAAAGALAGLACVGLGGVDLFRSTPRGLELLPQLAEIKWDNRPVVVVYDSDAATNLNVVRAQRDLARALVARGAHIRIASLPPAVDGGKQGLDDFLIDRGPVALQRLLDASPGWQESDALWSMNEAVLYVRDPGLVVERETRQRMDPSRFCSHHYANKHFNMHRVKTDAQGNQKIVSEKKPLARHWLEWERRSEVRKITYQPGQPMIFDGTYNTWPGWGCEPKKGDISPWVWLLDHVFKGKAVERKWFEQWCAFPIQHPGTKMFTYVLLWSVEQGTGKSFISYALKGIYGENAIEVGNDALRKGFNSWQENRQFVVGDEITAGEARLDADKLKRMICQPEVLVNQKFLPEYRIPDCINYLFNSNHPDAMFLEDRDRRGFVHRLPDDRLTEEFRQSGDLWLNSKQGIRDQKGPGPAHLFHHLLRVDLTGFDPSAPAPMTEAKEQMILNGKSSVGMWVQHLKDDPERCLRPLGEVQSKLCDLYTPAQLLRCYDPERTGKVTEPGVGRELSRAMFLQLKKIRTPAGTVRLYAVRNMEKWESATDRDIVIHYNRYFGPAAQKC